MSKLLDDFLNELRYLQGKSENTIKTYKVELEKFEDFLAKNKINIKQVKGQVIKNYIYFLSNNGHTPRTINKKISCLRTFFNYLEENEILNHNPTNKIKNIKCEKKLPKWLSEEEVTSILDKPKPKKDQLILELLYGSGLRVSELVNIKVKDIYLDKKRVVVKAKRKERYTPISQKCVEILKQHIKNLKSEDKILPVTPRTIQRRVKKYNEGLHPHMLRHSFSTHFLQNGGNIKNIQEILGHESLSTTQIYLHTTPDIALQDYEKYHPRAL